MRNVTLAVLVAGTLGYVALHVAHPLAQTTRFSETIAWSGDDVPFFAGGVTSDGARVALADLDGRLYIRATASGVTDIRELAGGRVEDVKVSPSGALIAMRWWNDQASVYQLRALAVDTSSDSGRVLYAGGQQEGRTRPLAWTPDGRSVVAWIGGSAAGRLSLLSADGDTERVLRRIASGAVGAADVSPDGGWVAFDSAGLSVIRTDGTGERQVVEDATARMLGWFPDGRHLLFASARTGTAGLWTVEVDEGRASSPRFLQAHTARMQPIGFARDGRFFAHLLRGGTNAYVMALDPATGRPRGPAALLRDDEAGVQRAHPSWAPDSRRIAFFRQPAVGPTTLVVQDTESGQRRSYALSVTNLGKPVWHPAGNRIAMLEESGQVAAFELDLGTGAMRQILGPTNAVEYAPDGEHLVYRRRAVGGLPNAIVQRHLITGEERVMHLGPGGFDLASDGKSFLIYTRNNSSLWTAPVGGQLRLVLAGIKAAANEFALSHDGRYAYFATTDPWEVWRVSTAGGPPEPLGLNLSNNEHISASSDGRYIAVSGGSSTAQVVVWSGFQQ